MSTLIWANILYIAEKIVWKSFIREKYNWFGNKKKLPLTKKKLKSHRDTKVCYICGKRILKKLSKSVNHRKVRYLCHYIGKYRSAAHSICNLKFNVPNEITKVKLAETSQNSAIRRRHRETIKSYKITGKPHNISVFLIKKWSLIRTFIYIH